MTNIYKERMVPVAQTPFVVFLFGIRINKLWKFNKWIPVIRARNRIIKELYNNKDSGFMAHESWLGNPLITLQYWRSYAQLIEYAREKKGDHFPAWVAFNEHYSGDGDIGIWHESYLIKEGCYEAVYKNMPIFGLGKATAIKAMKGARIQD